MISRLILAVLLMIVVGCSSGTDDTPGIDRFVVTGQQYLSFTAGTVYVICDTQTDLEYAHHFRGGLTPLGTACQPYVRLMSE